VTDTAIMLNVLKTPFGPVAGQPLPSDYTTFLQRGSLEGARIGIDRRQFEPDYFALPEINAVVEQALEVMADLGATIVDPVDTGDTFAWFDHEFNVLLYEFKVDVATYLATLRHTRMRTLADLIAFNRAHCTDEMKYFGQEVFELAEATSGDLSDPIYLEARAESLRLARDEGIDRVMAEHDLDAVVSPSYAFGSSAPSVAGYPSINVPVGLTEDGKPAGIWMYAGFLEEPTLLAYAYDLEQALGARPQPAYLNDVIPEPADAGLCPVPTASSKRTRRAGDSRRHFAGSRRRSW
jgi:amidase